MIRRRYRTLAFLTILAVAAFLVVACGRDRNVERVFPTPTPLPGAVVFVPESPLPQPDSPMPSSTVAPTWTPAPTPTPALGAAATPIPTPTWTPSPMPTATAWIDAFSDAPVTLSSGVDSSVTPRQAVLASQRYLAEREGVAESAIYADSWSEMPLADIHRSLLSVNLYIDGSVVQSGYPLFVDLETGAVIELEAVQELQAQDALAYRERCGRMDPQLCDAVADAAPDARFDVAIWVSDPKGKSPFDELYERTIAMFPEYANSGIETHEIALVRDHIMDDITQGYARPVLDWLQAHRVVASQTAGLPSVSTQVTAEQVRLLGSVTGVDTIFLISKVSPLEGAVPQETPEATATQISASPLIDARPVGLIGLPDNRLTEPVWSVLMPDGRAMALSQAEAEARALTWVAQTGGFASNELSINSEALMRFGQLGRDMMRVGVAHPALSDRWPYQFDYHLFVDLQSGEVFDEDAEGNPFVMYGSESFYGKFDAGLYEALKTVRVDVEMPVTLFLPDAFDASGVDSLDQLLTSLGAREVPQGANMPNWPGASSARMTKAQVLAAAQSPLVTQITYAGWPDPNYVRPTPTPLPAGWVEVPTRRVMPFSSEIAVGDQLGAMLLASAEDRANLLKDHTNLDQEAFDTMNFDANVYLLVTRGLMETSCLPIEITRVMRNQNVLRVYVDNWGSQGGMVCPAVFAIVSDMVEIAHSDLGIDPAAAQVEVVTQAREGSPSWGRP